MPEDEEEVEEGVFKGDDELDMPSGMNDFGVDEEDFDSSESRFT